MAAVVVPRSESLCCTSSCDSDLFYQKRPGRWEMATPQETRYPVVIFDGEQHVDDGHVEIHSRMQFKALQVALSQKTGVPPEKISVALVCRRGAKSREKRREKMLPINEKTNLAGILAHHHPRKEKDCFVLVTTRKSRRGRERRLRSRRNVVDDSACSGSSRDDLSPLANPYFAPPTGPDKPLVVRDPPPMPAAGIFDLSSVRIYPPVMSGVLGTMHGNSMVIGAFVTRNLLAYAIEYTYIRVCTHCVYDECKARPNRVCETCTKAGGGREVAFHPCVLDEVLEVHRSPPAGPIQRPSKPGRITHGGGG